MEKAFKSNQIRSNLLIEISSEIKNFINSNILINSISPKKLYDSYNVEITINNDFEFQTGKRKENQKYFPISPKIDSEKEVNEIPYMEIFKKINKIIISEKKNKNFYDKLDIIYTNNKSNIQETNDILTTTYDTPKKLLNNNNEEKVNKSIQFLRNYSRKFKLKLKPICKCRLKNLKNRTNPTINFKNEYKIIDNKIIEKPSNFQYFGLEGEIHCCCSKNKSNKIYDNIFTNKRCKISYNYSTYNHQKSIKNLFSPNGKF